MESLSCSFGVHWVLVCGGKGGGGRRGPGAACVALAVTLAVGLVRSTVLKEWLGLSMSGVGLE